LARSSFHERQRWLVAARRPYARALDPRPATLRRSRSSQQLGAGAYNTSVWLRPRFRAV